MSAFDVPPEDVGGKNEVNGECLLDFRTRLPDPEKTILGNRYLCRGGGMLFVGPSGMGKSSASVQQDILWSLGRPAFGIKPARPLKIVSIQAEDDEGDIHEMVEGVCKFLNITPLEESGVRERCVYVSHKSTTGQNFLNFVRKVLEKYKPDVLRINPFQAYIGADLKDPKVTADFLRTGLNPMMEEFNCAVVLVHHTPKTNFRDTDEWKTSDWMYAGAGSADVTNWARAILIADPTDDPHVFKWIAAKRGRRIGWADDNGEAAIIRYFSHSTNGGMHWDDTAPGAIPEDKKRGGAKKYSEQDVLDQMHMVDAMRTGEIQRKTMEETGMSRAEFYNLWNPLKESGKIIGSKSGWRKIL